MSKKKKKHHRIKSNQPARIACGRGIKCPRCSKPTQTWRWPDINARIAITKTFAYTHWFECTNRQCKTRTILPTDPSAVRHFDRTKSSPASVSEIHVDDHKPDAMTAEIESLDAHFRSI